MPHLDPTLPALADDALRDWCEINEQDPDDRDARHGREQQQQQRLAEWRAEKDEE